MVTPNYDEFSNSELEIKVRLTSGTSTYLALNKTNVLVCNSAVPSPVAPPWSNTSQFQFGNIVANETYNTNGHAIGNAYVYYRDNPVAGTENLFKKPLIVVEGIDFESYNQQNATNYQMGKFGWCALWGKDLVNYPQLANMEQLLVDFHNDGYDIIMLDFKDGSADIKENVYLLQTLIEKVNLYKTPDAEANVVMGASMGAIVSRYALADMEQDGKKHCTRLYISFDGPHQGASIPLGAQHFINFFGYNGVNNSAQAQNMMTQLSSPAAKQLLIYQIDGARKAVHDAFYLELDNLGYPTQCKNIAIANGSVKGFNQNYLGGSQIVDYNHTASGLFNLFVNGNIWALPGRSSDNMIFHGQMPFFETGFLSVSWGSVEQKVYVPSTMPHYDNAPGGVRRIAKEISDVDTKGNGTINSLWDDQCFIPSISALDLNTTNLFIDIDAALNNGTVSTPFDAVYGSIVNTFHVEATDGTIPNRGDNMGYVHNKTNSAANVANAVLATTYNYGELLNNTVTHKEVIANGKLYVYGNLVDGVSNVVPQFGFIQDYQIGTGCNTQELEIKNGGELILGDANKNNRANLYIKENAVLKVSSGGVLKIQEGSKLIIEPGANFIFEDGATIELLGNNAIIEIKGKVTVPDNTDLTFTGSGKLVIDQFIWGGNEDDFWDIGQNATLTLLGSSALNDVVLECKSNFIPRMQNQHTFSKITVKWSKIEMDEDAKMFIASPLEMLLVKMDVPGVSGHSYVKHGGLYLYGQSNISLTGCHFHNAENGIYNNLTGATQMFTLNSGAFRYCNNGLFTEGRNASVRATFEYNTIGWKHEKMLGQSFLTKSTFDNNGIGADFDGGNAHVDIIDNTFTNSTVGLGVSNILGANIQCNDFEHNLIGIEPYNATLFLNEEAYNSFFNNQYAIHGQFEENNGLNLKNGFNSFSLGTTGIDYINAQFYPNALISMHQQNGNWVLDADNNKMPLAFDPGFGNNPGGYFMPVSMTFFPTPTSNLTNLYLDVTNNLSSISRTCGSGIISNDENFEDYIISQFTSGQTLGTSNYSGMSLKTALIDAAGYISTEETQEDDLIAIDRLHEILTASYTGITQDDYNLLQVGYKLLTKALTRAYKFGDLTFVSADPVALVDGHLDKVILSIDAMKVRVDSAWPSAYQANFRYNLDEALMYRTGGYYGEAIAKLNSASSWATATELNIANYWLCACEAENDFLQEVISQEQFNQELQLCNALTNSFKSQERTFVNTPRIHTNGLITEMMRLLPNPAKEETTVYFENTAGGTLSIINVNGIELERYNVEKEQRKLILKVEGLVSGVYFLRYESNGENYSTKLIKE